MGFSKHMDTNFNWKLNRQICIEKASLDSEAFGSRSVIIDAEQVFFE